MLQVLFALLAGILTIAAPCILPVLPIVLGGTVGRQNKSRPFFIAIGFVAAFSVVGLALSVLTDSLMISPNALRLAAVGLLLVFGTFLVWSTPFEMLTAKLSGLMTWAGKFGNGGGNLSAFVLGAILGIVWTPCAGPVLGTILTLIATSVDTARAAILLFAYAVGAGVPMIIIGYGGQYLTTKIRGLARYSKRIQQVFGVLIILLALAMLFQYDTLIQSRILNFYNFGSIEQELIPGI